MLQIVDESPPIPQGGAPQTSIFERAMELERQQREGVPGGLAAGRTEANVSGARSVDPRDLALLQQMLGGGGASGGFGF
jgi:hypothetical protein